MSVPKFQYKKPLIVELSTGVSGSRNGVDLIRREFFGENDQNVTLLIGQEVATASNVQFNNITSSNGIKLGDDSLFLGDGFISSSNSVVAHTGSIVVTGNVTAPTITLNDQLTYGKLEVSVTGSTTIFDSGSSRFGDTLDDTHQQSGSVSITGSFGLNNYSTNEISLDPLLADGSATALATESGSFGYFEYLNVPNRLAYIRKSFVHTGSFTNSATSSFNAITASAPSELSGTTEQDFMFFINGMLIENDALTIVQKTSTNLELRLDTSELGYEIASVDEIVGFGKFNS